MGNGSADERIKATVAKLSSEQKRKLFENVSKLPEDKRQAALLKFIDEFEARNKPVKNAPSSPTSKSNASEPKVAKGNGRKPRTRRKSKVRRIVRIASRILILILAALVVVGALVALFMGGKFVVSKIIDASRSQKQVETTLESTTIASSEVSTTMSSETTTAATATPTVTSTPTPTPVPVASDHPDLTGLVVVIDPGHQGVDSEEEELCATWLSITKPCGTTGATGASTGVTEYELMLDIGNSVRSYLEQCGATVVMTREDNISEISNQERANIAVVSDADVFIRLHADAANDAATSGVRVFVPDTGSYIDSSLVWGDALGNLVSEALGQEFIETRATYTYTGLNYANSVPSFQIVLGYLTNSDDEALLLDEDNQVLIAEAIAEFCGSM